MRHQRFSLSEWVRVAEQNVKAVFYLLGVVLAGCGLALTVAAWWMDRRIEAHTQPILEAFTWKLETDGQLQDYLRFKARKDSLAHVAIPSVSSAGYPLWRTP